MRKTSALKRHDPNEPKLKTMWRMGFQWRWPGGGKGTAGAVSS